MAAVPPRQRKPERSPGIGGGPNWTQIDSPTTATAKPSHGSTILATATGAATHAMSSSTATMKLAQNRASSRRQ